MGDHGVVWLENDKYCIGVLTAQYLKKDLTNWEKLISNGNVRWASNVNFEAALKYAGTPRSRAARASAAERKTARGSGRPVVVQMVQTQSRPIHTRPSAVQAIGSVCSIAMRRRAASYRRGLGGISQYVIEVLPIDMPTAEDVANRAVVPDSPVRERLIDTAREGWTNRLIDLSRRNNLLFYKPVASGTLELPFSQRMRDFLSDGQTATISDLVANDNEPDFSHPDKSLMKCLENFEEKGLLTLYLALGRCTWTADDGEQDPIAPVLLVPVGLKFKGRDIQTTDAAHEPDSAITSALC